jgi:hypothetical protein
MKTYLIGTGTANRTRSKWFGSFCSSFGDSVFITVVIIALVFGMIPSKNLDICIEYDVLYDQFISFSKEDQPKYT